MTWALFTIILSNSTLLGPNYQIIKVTSLSACKSLQVVMSEEYKGFISVNECIQVAK